MSELRRLTDIGDDGYDVMWDPEAMSKYGGKWVVAIGREVIAFGDDPKKAREEAAAKLGVDVSLLGATAVMSHDSIW